MPPAAAKPFMYAFMYAEYQMQFAAGLPQKGHMFIRVFNLDHLLWKFNSETIQGNFKTFQGHFVLHFRVGCVSGQVKCQQLCRAGDFQGTTGNE